MYVYSTLVTDKSLRRLYANIEEVIDFINIFSFLPFSLDHVSYPNVLPEELLERSRVEQQTFPFHTCLGHV